MNLYQMNFRETEEIVQMSRPHLTSRDLKIATDLIHNFLELSMEQSANIDILRNGEKIYTISAYAVPHGCGTAIAVPVIVDQINRSRYCKLSTGSGVEYPEMLWR